MNIPPLPPNFAAAIAGVDRAAQSQVAKSSTSEPGSIAPAATKNVDSIDKGNASNDSGADGRQLLDTFEQRKRDDDEEEKEETKPTLVSFKDPNAKPAPRLDLNA